ncbi:lipoyl(octanoyl) transferase [Malonomonas rubra DSM 5091]|uniref:Octanoyltransferase n=1 Tax=Malonomonas rubra DSM 5091 TaxID=1122189 RepID=A0A1M6DB31_MALRU|nr:lipoyl(octanoyl) transferase LipB [Malonomonas rubra]SHI70444.1 lipoyl(octanoyl) transferase [Malonomonas rubra DSM 5091]
MAKEIPLTDIVIADWGLLDYEESFHRQQQLVEKRLQGEGDDTLVLVEHPPVVTLGRRASGDDLRVSVDEFSESGIALRNINRGGLATAHEPGQLVAYPIVALKRKDLRWFADGLLNAVIALLADYGLEGNLKEGEPGVWVNGRKICSFGIAVKKWVSCHGIALNVNNDLQTFHMIVPCGRPDEQVTSVSSELGEQVDLKELGECFCQHFLRIFAYRQKAC